MSDKHTHTSDCEWHIDQYPWECTCGAIPKKQAMDNLIAQDADLIDKLRDEDSYYRLQEKHWCIDAEELERQRLAAADRIEADGKLIAELDGRAMEYLLLSDKQAQRVAELKAALDNIANESSDTWAREKARAALGEKQ